ncbi:hypothetical protein [Glaciimonas sp. PCH181]|uniref:hypothetical protein n=1 Tax=Glaciimonas sp. PCH181 TaxID=2133943 RepID=UPI000D356BC9|nr:hypothetical protein [Glaciimonas sp. PCH181]PUA17163.1 hypothetical protein C7W93_14555 [Glaciimonas sp. PCH181]
MQTACQQGVRRILLRTADVAAGVGSACSRGKMIKKGQIAMVMTAMVSAVNTTITAIRMSEFGTKKNLIFFVLCRARYYP